ncbi:MAG: glycosyltransferase [Candidatus Heimdallarchaeota archaeon]
MKKYLNAPQRNPFMSNDQKRNLKVSVVIPAYNEVRTVRKVVKCAMKAKHVDEVIVVDDGSTDGTSKKIKDLDIKIIRHKDNKGKGCAIKSGIRASKGDIILFLDADLTNITPEKIEKLIVPILRNKADFVKAAFKLKRGRVTEFAVKPLMKFLFPEARFVQPIGGQFATRKEFLQKIDIVKDWGTDISILLDAIRWKLRIKEVYIGEIKHKKRPFEEKAVMAEQVIKTILEKAKILRKRKKK